MGMSLQSTGRRGRGRGRQMIGDINVTPLVDVMLVLLIVFMVTAPLLTSGVPIDLPQTAAPELKVESKPITVSINTAGEVYLGVENPKGELGYYLVSDGTAKPVRWRIRPPSFLNLAALPKLCEGALLSDVIAINASVDIVMGEIDR